MGYGHLAYQLRVTLVDSAPEVWREIRVPAYTQLKDLHDILQIAMGWENQHPYLFRAELGQSPCSADQVLIDVLTATGYQPMYYTYDLTGGWLHRIDAQKLEAQESEAQESEAQESEAQESEAQTYQRDDLDLNDSDQVDGKVDGKVDEELLSSLLPSLLPVCTDGAFACPPEGSGGVWGYDEFLSRLENPDDPDYFELIEKYGDFNPDKFDTRSINSRYQQLGLTEIYELAGWDELDEMS